MSWVRIDDGMHDHDKMFDLSGGPCFDNAVSLWLRAATWSSSKNKAGFVPTGAAKALANHPDAISELVRVQFWAEVDGGYQFCNWTKYNPPAEVIAARRQQATERKAAYRAKKRAESSDQTSLPLQEQSHDVCVSRMDIAGCPVGVPGGTGIGDLELLTSQTEDTEVNNSPPTRAPASEAHDSTPQPLPAAPDRAPPAPPEPPALRLVKSDPPPALPRVVAPPAGYNHQDMIRDFSRLRKAAGGGAQAYQHTLYDCSQAVLAWAVEECPTDPKGAILKSIENYLLDEWAGGTGWPYKFWAGDPGKWHAAKPGLKRSKRAGNPAPVSTREELELSAQSNPSWAIGGAT